ncbi:hypothetical protein P5V34_04390 [Mycobacteroides abscessus subsp. abscessus]|uniref:hypothetical protein n=1 Tax=Mycobacteroides abscessus TaxID=36809 RepID=UPI00266C4060|nr:hypothetical protein [Mycobacteroides abscessus]MDO3013225.1 hypothetical protein [Mycobacteroides abscessus subsp. abscessus]
MSPVDAGACADPGVLGGVGSWEAVALDTAVVMACAAAGMSGSGTLGRTGDLALWWVSLGWLACAAFPAGVPDEALDDLALVLAEFGVPDGPLPEMSPARVGLATCGLVVGVLGVLGASAFSAVVEVVALGIGGSWCGATAGWSPWLYAATCTAGL